MIHDFENAKQFENIYFENTDYNCNKLIHIINV